MPIHDAYRPPFPGLRGFGGFRGRGFTIIELLVVISIVILLIGLLLPALSKARETSRRTVCMSNLRQIGVGLQGYRDANGGRVPEAQTLPVDPYSPSIMSFLDPHLNNSREIWECPSDEELFPELATSYEYFIGFYLTMIDVEQYNAGQRKNDLVKFFSNYPTMAFVMNDAEGFHDRIGPAEAGGRNSLFLDGHVDWFILPQGGGGP